MIFKQLPKISATQKVTCEISSPEILEKYFKMFSDDLTNQLNGLGAVNYDQEKLIKYLYTNHNSLINLINQLNIFIKKNHKDSARYKLIAESANNKIAILNKIN